MHQLKCLKIHQLNYIKIIKKDCKKKLVKGIKVFLKKKKVTKIYKNLPKDEKQKLVEYRKYIIRLEKMPFYNYKKLFSFKKPTSILKSNDLKKLFDEEYVQAKYQDAF